MEPTRAVHKSACVSLFRWLALLAAHSALAQQIGQLPPAWSPGTFDIHQIQTGRGNAAFLIFPDGTTALIDAGAVPDRPGPALAPARPNSSRTPAQWIARYIDTFSPMKPAALDYLVVTHYHDDHMGAVPELAGLIPIRHLLDRGDSPPLPPSDLIEKYRAFRKTPGLRWELFHPGRADQIITQHGAQPDFEVRNIAANGEVWTGKGSKAISAFPLGWDRLPKEEQPSENSFSIALRIRYGRFDYYTGGDLPGMVLDNLPAWQDVETPVARVVGPVDVAVLDHHGWLDTTNPFFLRALQPRVVVIPAWHATHPDHGVVRRLISERSYPGPRDLFITTLLDAPRAILSYLPQQPFRSTEGHIMIRVSPGGGTYRVFILDDQHDSPVITAIYGPWQSR